MENFLCYACETDTPRAFGHKHHVIPQSAGGTEKDIVFICAACHSYLHSIAYALLNPKRHHEVDQLLMYYKDDNARRKIATLANTAAEEMMNRTEKADMLEDVPIKVVIEVTRSLHTQLSFAAKDKRKSMSSYVLAAIQEKLAREI